MTVQDLQPVSIRGLIAFHLYYIEKAVVIENITGQGWDFVLDKGWYILENTANLYGVMDSIREISPNMMCEDDGTVLMTYQEYLESSRILMPSILLTELQFNSLKDIYSVNNNCVLAMLSVYMLSSAAEVGGVYELEKDRIQKRIDYLEHHEITIPPIENFLSCGFSDNYDKYGLPVKRAQIMHGIMD